MHRLLRELYPICRSITGEGVRQTLRILGQHLPPGLDVREVPSGTAVLDWTVPPEWNIRDAYIKDQHGRRVVDFQRHSLHVVSYSVPVPPQWLTRQELDAHLHSLPAQPTLTPYRTSYYQPTWGFCLPHQLREQLQDERYEVCIDADLNPAGSLTYGQLVLPGDTDEEVLFSCHICHPSLANDNLAGVVTAAWLAQWLAARPRRRYTYRFVFVPGTIGSISWLHEHRHSAVPRIKHGLVLSLLGGPGEFTYKRSRQGTAAIDRVVAAVLREAALGAHQLRDFSPYGYDERQYCSPGFNLPVGCLTRTPFAEFPEYHTSADNPSLVRPRQLAASMRLLRLICRALEQHDRRYQNRQPYGEPQLGRRGLYGALKGTGNPKEAEMALLWVLSLADGQHDALTMAERSGLSFSAIRRAVRSLCQADLLAAL
ncbi:peptidase M28 [Hymenobacter sp. CRA2]|nr:peptidase M28 [Hymenobacter sp. CRA2]